MLLKDLYDAGHVLLLDGPLGWREALRASVGPLVADGSVDACYGDELVANVERFGTYIVLAPDLAMPHAGEGARGVNASTMSLTRVRMPVRFDDGREARVFFTLADLDPESHLENMRRLYDVISRPEIVRMLAEVDEPEDLLEIDAMFAEER